MHILMQNKICNFL